MKQRRAEGQEAPKENRGSLKADGGWSRVFTAPTFTEKYVREVCRVRVAAQVSPAELAAKIRASNFTEAFPLVMQGAWDAITEWDKWHIAPHSTSAECIVVYCGVGAGSGHWRGGEYVFGPDLSPKGNLDPKPLLDALYASLGVPNTHATQPTARNPLGHPEGCTCEVCFAPAWSRVAAAQAVGL